MHEGGDAKLRVREAALPSRLGVRDAPDSDCAFPVVDRERAPPMIKGLCLVVHGSRQDDQTFADTDSG